MKRFVHHYTCKKIEQTGVTCLKILSDYASGVGVYEKKIKDLHSIAKSTNDKITRLSSWKVPIIYDLISLAIKKFNITLVKEADFHPDDDRGIKEYSMRLRSELIKKGLNEEINEDIENKLADELKKRPVMLLINFNELYKQRNAGIGWIIITEYNHQNNEFIVYDPMYYTRLPRNRNWQRLPNTPKKRFISFKANYLLEVWRKTKETTVYSTVVARKKAIQPFQREFFSLTKKDI